MKATFSKTLLTLLTVGLISCALFSPQAQAVPVTGSITFGGTVELDSPSAATATAVTAWHFAGTTGSPYVSSTSGSFALIPTTTSATIFAPWSFNTNSTINSFWSVTSGGQTFTFDLMISAITSQGTNAQGQGFVTVSGTGVVHGTGFDDTFGSWSFTTQGPSANGVFSFSASSASRDVPDGGATVALLGLALAGVEGLRWRLKRRGRV